MIYEDLALCECGHVLGDHHRSYFLGGGMWAEECEVWGFNEYGGMQHIPGYGWVDHCQRFKPVYESKVLQDGSIMMTRVLGDYV